MKLTGDRVVRRELCASPWSARALLCWSLCWLWLAWLAAPALAADQQSPSRALRVLVIASYDKDLPSQRHLEEGLNDALAAMAGPPPQLHFEYLDAARIDLAAQRGALLPYLQARYGDQGIDVVGATSTQAVDFLAGEPGLLPQARRVFADVPATVLPRIRARDPQVPVIAVQSNYPASLREALRLTAPRRLVVIGETRDEAARLRLTLFQQAAAQVLAQPLPIEYWLDRPLPELLQRAARLEPGAVLYYLLQFSDGQGHEVTPLALARRITAVASVPMVSQWETLVGSGVVGGYCTSQRMIGGQLARAIVAGAVTSGGTAADAGMRPVYDWRALQRWHLDEAALPPGSVVLYREPGLLTRYRGAVFVLGAMLAILLVLLGLLLAAQRARQRMLDALAGERSLLAQRVAERTAELGDRVSELARRNEDLMRVKTQLSLLANTDGLTGLANRRHLDEVLAQELRRMQRSGSELSLLMLDVDHFKEFNDRYGHTEGDRCLQAIAGLLAGLCRRPADLAARFGGEEFVLVLPDTPLAGALARAQQMMHALAMQDWPHAASPVAPRVTVSIGVVATQGAVSAEALLARVDAQLYRAKSEGRNRIAAAGPGAPAAAVRAAAT
ncbi:diguanylate cyclase [Aquabacterium sp.]|uniref:GGDEF domain-containing protein n=1 Tax=Aquabacterium sp. TaxID=1872578 RepID=UPI0037838099